IDIEPPHHPRPGDRLLPHRRAHRPAVPGHVPRHPHIDRQQSARPAAPKSPPANLLTVNGQPDRTARVSFPGQDGRRSPSGRYLADVISEEDRRLEIPIGGPDSTTYSAVS